MARRPGPLGFCNPDQARRNGDFTARRRTAEMLRYAGGKFSLKSLACSRAVLRRGTPLFPGAARPDLRR